MAAATAKGSDMTQTTNNQQPTTSPQQPAAELAYVTNRWSRTVAQPILITVMFTAFIAGPLTVLQQIMPAAPWQAFTPIFFFLILETVYTTLWLKRPTQRGLNNLAYRAAELLIFVVLTRLLTWGFTNSWPSLEMWQSFLFEPITFFADGFFLVIVIAVFLVWQMTIQITYLFMELALDRAEAAYYAAAFGKHQLDTRPDITDRGRLVASFLHQWLFGGLVLVICAALSTFDLLEPAAGRSLFSIGRLSLPRQLLLSLVFYFLAGFLLLSQGRLALLNARWLINGVQKNERLERSWYRFSLRLLALVAFVAALLPLGSTIALGQIVRAVIEGITAVITFIMALIIALLSLFLPATTQLSESAPLPPAEPLVMPPPAPATEASETLQIVGSSAFWAVAIVLTMAAFLFFLRERGISVNKEMWQQVWTAVTQWWRSLRKNVSRQMTTARQAIQARRQQRPDGILASLRPRQRFIRLNALSPRDQLRYFYLSTLERAGQRGVARQKSETPLEFAQDLKENWPDAEVDVETLTDAFLQARYSPQPIEVEQVNPVKEHWKQLRARLRRRQKR
jgi:hypothetical protein